MCRYTVNLRQYDDFVDLNVFEMERMLSFILEGLADAIELRVASVITSCLQELNNIA